MAATFLACDTNWKTATEQDVKMALALAETILRIDREILTAVKRQRAMAEHNRRAGDRE